MKNETRSDVDLTAAMATRTSAASGEVVIVEWEKGLDKAVATYASKVIPIYGGTKYIGDTTPEFGHGSRWTVIVSDL